MSFYQGVKGRVVIKIRLYDALQRPALLDPVFGAEAHRPEILLIAEAKPQRAAVALCQCRRLAYRKGQK